MPIFIASREFWTLSRDAVGTPGTVVWQS